MNQQARSSLELSNKFKSAILHLTSFYPSTYSFFTTQKIALGENSFNKKAFNRRSRNEDRIGSVCGTNEGGKVPTETMRLCKWS